MSENLTPEEKAVNHDTWRHIHRVQHYVLDFAKQLIDRAHKHDQTKLVPPEVSYFAEVTPKLAGLEYGSEEYRAQLRGIKPALDHHYAHNRHHPEYSRANREEWRAVVGYEGLYEVSNFGEVRSLDRPVENPGSRGPRFVSGQIRKPHLTPRGYLRLQLVRDIDGEKEKRNHFVHRLVAEAFLDNPDGKPEVNHKNGDKRDNRLWNLEWVTTSENLIHAYETGLKEPNVKYVVVCEELDIVTLGTTKMQRELWRRGYERASAAAIWACINGVTNAHLDLTFTAYPIEEYVAPSPVDDMNLLDLVEMLADWKAASERHNDGNIRKSLEINAERFGFSPQLRRIFENTIEALKAD